MNTSCIYPWPDGRSCLSFPLPRSVYQPEAVTADRHKFVLSPSPLLGLSCNSSWPSGFDSVSWRPTAVKQQQACLFYQFFFLIFCTLLHWKKFIVSLWGDSLSAEVTGEQQGCPDVKHQLSVVTLDFNLVLIQHCLCTSLICWAAFPMPPAADQETHLFLQQFKEQ